MTFYGWGITVTGGVSLSVLWYLFAAGVVDPLWDTDDGLPRGVIWSLGVIAASLAWPVGVPGMLAIVLGMRTKRKRKEAARREREVEEVLRKEGL